MSSASTKRSSSSARENCWLSTMWSSREPTAIGCLLPGITVPDLKSAGLFTPRTLRVRGDPSSGGSLSATVDRANDEPSGASHSHHRGGLLPLLRALAHAPARGATPRWTGAHQDRLRDLPPHAFEHHGDAPAESRGSRGGRAGRICRTCRS